MAQPTEGNGKILVTGSAGRVGRAVVSALLRAGYSITGFDRTPSPQLADSDQIIGSLTDRAKLQSALRNVSAVVHLAATPDDSPEPGWWEEQLVPNNILGVHHLLELCQKQGIQKLLLASTGQLNWWQQFEGPWPIHPSHPITPRHWYAATKVFLEAAAQSYARAVPNSTVLALRLGWCPRAGQEAEFHSSPTSPNVFLSQKDAGSFYLAALQASLPTGFHALYVTSKPVHKTLFDLEPAFQLTGWRPSDQWNGQFPTDTDAASDHRPNE